MLNVKNIKLNMTARTKEEVIEELTDLLIQDGAVTNKEDFIRDVWLREELGSTGFENHIAIPHGKSSGVSRTALAIGRTQHAIPWETMDGSDVRCVILFAVCCGEVIVYAWMERRRENSGKPYGTRLRAGLAVSARLVGK